MIDEGKSGPVGPVARPKILGGPRKFLGDQQNFIILILTKWLLCNTVIAVVHHEALQ